MTSSSAVTALRALARWSAVAFSVTLQISHADAAHPLFPVPPPPPGTFVTLGEQYLLIGGLGGGWAPAGSSSNGIQCVGNFYCRAPAGTILPPSGYKFCNANLVSASMTDGVTFSGTANINGTLSYSSAVNGVNKSLNLHMNLVFMKVAYPGLGCVQGPVWQCGAGTTAGAYRCKFYKSPVVIK
jgi:hypothetical protein